MQPQRTGAGALIEEFEHFDKAPIVEAVLDIRVSSPKPPELDVLAKVQARAGSDFANKEVRSAWTGEFEFGQGKKPIARTTAGPVGYLFRSGDGRRVIQARQDGFSFSLLRPYTDWKSLSDEARGLWKHYVSIAKPTKVVRIALRYINRIDLPSPVELKDYFLTIPEVAPDLPQQLSTFFYRVVLPFPEARAVAVVIQTVDEQAMTNVSVPVILDIDVFRGGTLPIDADKLWPMFEDLRQIKNKIFHRSLKDRTKDLFR